jgi:hypothetical protein
MKNVVMESKASALGALPKAKALDSEITTSKRRVRPTHH